MAGRHVSVALFPRWGGGEIKTPNQGLFVSRFELLEVIVGLGINAESYRLVMNPSKILLYRCQGNSIFKESRVVVSWLPLHPWGKGE